MRKTLALFFFLGISASAQSVPGGSIVIGGASVNSAIAAATTQGVVGQHQAGAYSPLDYGITCGAALSSRTVGQRITYSATGVTGDIGLTKALADVGHMSGSQYAGPTGGIDLGNFGNMMQGRLSLPPNSICTAVGPVMIPPGVAVEGNNSTLYITGTGHGLYVSNNGPNGNYGAIYNQFRNLTIIGPGVGTSQGNGIFVDVGVKVHIENVHMYQFKHGFELDNVQYSMVFNSWASGNEVGCVWSSTGETSTGALLSIDDNMIGGGCVANTKTGLWEPAGTLVRMTGVSRSWNRHEQMVIGPMPSPYVDVNGYTATAAGSGCTATSTAYLGNNGTATPIAPLTVTDPGSGLGATGFVALSAATNGAVIGAYGINAGKGYTSPRVSVAACTGAPTITALLVNDQTTDPQGIYGSQIGTTVDDAGDFEGDGYRSDGSPERPSYGAMIYLGADVNGYVLRRPFFGTTSNGDDFVRLMINDGLRTELDSPQGYGGSNPLNSADRCQIVSSQQAGIFAKFAADDSASGLSCDTNYNPNFGNSNGWKGLYGGSDAANGYSSIATNATYGMGFQSFQIWDSQSRYFVYSNGHTRFGNGSFNSGIGFQGDTGFNRTGVGLLTYDSDTYLTNLPLQWQNGVGTNLSAAITGDINNFFTGFNRTTGGAGWHTGTFGLQWSDALGGFQVVGANCADTSTTGSYTACTNFFVSSSAGVKAPGYQENLTTPASSTAACTAGQFTDDANFHYVCTATNTWKRVALSAF